MKITSVFHSAEFKFLQIITIDHFSDMYIVFEKILQVNLDLSTHLSPIHSSAFYWGLENGALLVGICRYHLYADMPISTSADIADTDTAGKSSFSAFQRVLVCQNRTSRSRDIAKKVHACLRMYCIDAEALVFMFNGGSPYGFTIHLIFTRICMLYLHY